jgi:two-component system nitrate/nitrite response regulator NarL
MRPASNGKLRICVADDHEMLRRGIEALVCNHGLGELCGEASNGEEAVTLVRDLKPDLLILDISMPVMNGIEAARQIRKFSATQKILILTIHDSPQIIQAAQEAGANAVIMKSETNSELVDAIQRLFHA